MSLTAEQPKTRKAKAAPVETLGSLIDKLWAQREAKRIAEAEVKKIEALIEPLEIAVMERLDEQGLDKANGRAASVSMSTNTIANVEDWDAFWAYIIKNKYTQMLQKRVSDPAYRELLEMGKNIPGVKPFSKRRLNLRTSA